MNKLFNSQTVCDCDYSVTNRHKSAISTIFREKKFMSMNMGSTFNYMNNFLVQESIALMFVALGLTILGIGYARIKNKESLQLHRWVMRGAVILTMIAIFFVMFPSLFIYYTTLSNSVLSGFSILQLVHSAKEFPP